VWSEIERRRGVEKLSAVAGPAPVIQGEWSQLQRDAMRTRQIAEHIEGDTVTFAVPILLREQVLGAVEWQVPHARYTHDARQTALELTTRFGLAAENIRLFEQSRQAAQRELLVNQISSKLMGSTNIDQILQTAVRELGDALRLPRTAIRLYPPDESPDGKMG
jgi:GAF domain-containing protein